MKLGASEIYPARYMYRRSSSGPYRLLRNPPAMNTMHGHTALLLEWNSRDRSRSIEWVATRVYPNDVDYPTDG